MSVAKIVDRVQLLLEAQGEDWCSSDYVIQYLAIVSQNVESKLENLDLSFDTDVITLPAVPAGTLDLSDYQQDGRELSQMVLPVALEWRLVGETDTQWKQIPKKDKVIDVMTRPGIASYEWRHGLVFISPSSVDVDIRIRTEDLPAVVDSDSATYIKGLDNVLVFGIAEMVAVSRGGPSAANAIYFAGMKTDAFDDVADRMVKDEQMVERVMGSRRQFDGWPRFPAMVTMQAGGSSGDNDVIVNSGALLLLTPVPDGGNVTFTLPGPIDPTSSWVLVRNGVVQNNPADFTLVATSIIFAVAPSIGDTLCIIPL